MVYEYGGYLKSILEAPRGNPGEGLEQVVFTAEDLAQWSTKDLPAYQEWQNIPVSRMRREGAVRLVGRFEDVARIDCLPVGTPGFWVPLSSLGWNDPRFPIDTARYPVLELKYQCAGENAMPAVVWTYPGGLNQVTLPSSPTWRTVARCVAPFGFPTQINSLTIRLYSAARTSESLDLEWVRFRALSPAETQALRAHTSELAERPKPQSYRLLDEFMPVGVCVDAGAAHRLAEMLGIGLGEYWGLAFEDIVKHHHNTIALDNVSQLSSNEWDELLASAGSYGLKIVANHHFPNTTDRTDWREIIENTVKPYADSDTIMAWGLCKKPGETELRPLLDARDILHEVDPKHPLHVTTSFPSGLGVFGPHFAVTGFSYPCSRAPWELGEMIRQHIPQVAGQQLWVEAPAFVYATGCPLWNTCPEMRLMVNLAFANGVRGWFSASYHSEPIWAGGTCERSLTGPFLAFSDLWSELDMSMARYLTMAPMLLRAEPAAVPSPWYMVGVPSVEHGQLPDGVPAIGSYRLCGNDYDLFIVISNDVRGISSLDINIPAEVMKGLEIYDLNDLVQARRWVPMDLRRHIEMFPGEARVMLVGPPQVCAFWHDAIAWHLAQDDQRQLAFDMKLAEKYGQDISPVEEIIRKVNESWDVAKLAMMDQARAVLLDLIYATPAIADARSAIIDATAAVCGCDGALCRLVGRGKIDLAQEWGLKVVPLAREFTQLRLELRQGKGPQIIEHARDTAQRAFRLLDQIRGLTRSLVGPRSSRDMRRRF